MNPEPEPLYRRNGSREAEPSLGDLLRQLAAQMGQLLRQEVTLARAELSHGAERLQEEASKIVLGAAIAVPGVTVILGGLAIGLAEFVPLWLAALIVGGVALTVGLVFIGKGRKGLQDGDIMPERTMKSVRETVTGGAA